MKTKILFLILVFAFVFVPFQYASSSVQRQPLPSIGQTQDLSTGSGEIDNPIGIDDPRQIIGNVIKAILGIVGSLALLMFIYGGFTWITSGGNDEKVKKGKDAIVWAALGLAIIFFSYAMVNFVITAATGV